MKTFKVKEKCQQCNGTGIYDGFGERGAVDIYGAYLKDECPWNIQGENEPDLYRVSTRAFFTYPQR